MLLTGAHERNIDDKNRIQIPAPHRDVLDPDRKGARLYVVPGERDRTLSLFPKAQFERKVASMRTDQTPGTDALDFEQMFLSLASPVDMDKQGRLVLPEQQLTMVDLGKAIYVTGARFRLDVWPKELYEAFVVEAMSRRSKLAHFLRQPTAE